MTGSHRAVSSRIRDRATASAFHAAANRSTAGELGAAHAAHLGTEMRSSPRRDGPACSASGVVGLPWLRPVGVPHGVGRGLLDGWGAAVTGVGGRRLAVVATGLQGTAEDTRGILVVVSATMITVTGLVFPLTIVALQIASGPVLAAAAA
jgi:hypothetical protein